MRWMCALWGKRACTSSSTLNGNSDTAKPVSCEYVACAVASCSVPQRVISLPAKGGTRSHFSFQHSTRPVARHLAVRRDAPSPCRPGSRRQAAEPARTPVAEEASRFREGRGGKPVLAELEPLVRPLRYQLPLRVCDLHGAGRKNQLRHALGARMDVSAARLTGCVASGGSANQALS